MLRCGQDGLLTKLSQHGTEKATPEPWGWGCSGPLHSPQGIFFQWHFAMCQPFVSPSSSSLLRSSVTLPTAVFAKAKANGGNGSQVVNSWTRTSMKTWKEGGSWEKSKNEEIKGRARSLQGKVWDMRHYARVGPVHHWARPRDLIKRRKQD